MINATDYESIVSENTALKAENAKLSSQLAEVLSQLEWLKRQIYGQKSERVIPISDGQYALDIQGVPQTELPTTTTPIAGYSRKNPRANKTPHGREEIPAHIPRVTVEIEPDYDATGMEKIGEKVTEQLEFKQAEFYVTRYVRTVHATMKNGQRTLVCVDMPPLCIDKGKLGPTVVAQTIISKCQDHIPHYRTAQMINRDCDMSIPESTIRDAFKQGVFLIDALVKRLEEIALKSNYLQMDESTIKVMIQPTQGKSHRGYIFVRHAPLEKIILFDYQKTRNVERGKKLLGNFQGTLQSDGLNLYPIICKDLKLTPAGCMDHCRRGFDEALTNDKARATQALDLIRPLYAVEETARVQSLTAAQRFTLRQEQSVPLYKKFIDWCNENLKQVTPKSNIGKAIIYTVERTISLRRFLEDGFIEISDIMIENGIRPLAIGRKNYLFAGSEDGAQRLAVVYSIIGTCIKNGLNVRDYLNHVLRELPKRMSNNIDDLLPTNWIDPDTIK